jgi:RNA polymerase sigma-70 factor (ECF subfamily)
MDLRDPHHFSRVYDDHHRAVYATAQRVLNDHALASDVVQDVFLRLWRRPQAFDASRGEIGTYLRLMARSRAVDLWRESQSRGRAADRLKLVVADEPPRGPDRPDDALERDDERAAVRAALRGLPQSQREALVLAYWGGMTAEQIASREEIPLGTAKSRIRLGLAKLRDEVAAVAAAPVAPAAA